MKEQTILPGGFRLAKALSVILALVIIGAIGVSLYVVVVPKAGESFTEFYILGAEGKATGYPRELSVMEAAKITVVIVNRERKETTYRVETTINGVKDKDIGPVVLANDEKWEQEVSFTTTSVGDNQKVEFTLYKEGENNPYLRLRLWVNVKE